MKQASLVKIADRSMHLTDALVNPESLAKNQASIPSRIWRDVIGRETFPEYLQYQCPVLRHSLHISAYPIVED
jgi:hypothetical protein